MKPYYSDDLVTIYHGDGREVLPTLGPVVDLVLTDPPYGTEYLPVIREMAVMAAGAMRLGASLVSLCGNHQVPEVIDAFREAGLRYWWLAGMRYAGATQRFPGKWVLNQWKPAVWFVKESRRRGDTSCPGDMMPGGGNDKTFHKWGQPVAWFQHWATRLTPYDGLVVDPFMGAGTTLVAAKSASLHAIGIEIEERYCEIAANRCSQEVLGLAV